MIVIFIAFSVSLLVLSNAVFDSTERGVEKVFRSGFTGDFMIRPVSDRPCSLLGDETPIVGAGLRFFPAAHSQTGSALLW